MKLKKICERKKICEFWKQKSNLWKQKKKVICEKSTGSKTLSSLKKKFFGFFFSLSTSFWTRKHSADDLGGHTRSKNSSSQERLLRVFFLSWQKWKMATFDIHTTHISWRGQKIWRNLPLSFDVKVQIFWKGLKVWKKISHLFWRCWVKTTVLSKQGWDFFKFCGPLIMSELYT